MKKGDLIILAAVLTAVVGMWGAFFLFGDRGGQAVLVTPTETITLPLAEDTVLTVTGRNDIAVTVEVANGAVRFSHSNCPDKLCVHSGALKQSGTAAACVPAGVTLRVVGDNGEVDAIAN